MSHSSFDLNRSISMHPHPFNLSRADTPASSHSHQSPLHAASTAIEAIPLEERDAISRHPTATQGGADLEHQRGPFGSNDPYRLSSAYKSESELNTIKANMSKKRDGCNPIGFDKGSRHARKVQGFYEEQNSKIELLLKPVEDHRNEAKQEQGDNHLKYKIAVWGSFGANLILAGLQIYGAASSDSLSLFTTMADAIFDPLSNATLILTNRAIKNVDPNRFPSGKARLETIGNIAFCFIMTSVSLILIAFSAQELSAADITGTKTFHLPSVIAVSIAFLTKFTLLLYCWALKSVYSQVDILWQDHRNDLMINGFGLLTSVGGSKLVWWIDPMGAIIISCIISFLWLRTAFCEFLLLVGVTAPVEMQQLITYICLTHSPEIQGIDTVRCYHSGPRLIAEVDIVMNPEWTLKHTHDVAEELQMKLESLPDIERAYVHVDYETTHKPEHFYKKDI